MPAGKVSTNGMKDQCANPTPANIIVELFWVDLVVQNPLDAVINLSNVTLVVQESDPSSSARVEDLVEVEVIKEVTIGPKEAITVRVSMNAFHTLG